MGLIVPASFPRSVKRPAPASVYRALESRFPEALESARTLLRQPSVSATGEGVAECAEMVREMMAGIGCKTRTWKKRGYPLVIGDLDVGAPVTLIEYEMYDVQPVGDLEAWKVPPFAADIREVPGIGKAIVARGSTNSKGALANHLFTWRTIQDVDEMPVKLKIIDKDERPVIDGIWDEVQRPTKQEVAMVHRLAKKFDPRAWLREGGVAKFKYDLPKTELLLRYLYEPTVNICGIHSGYVDHGG